HILRSLAGKHKAELTHCRTAAEEYAVGRAPRAQRFSFPNSSLRLGSPMFLQHGPAIGNQASKVCLVLFDNHQQPLGMIDPEISPKAGSRIAELIPPVTICLAGVW